MDIDVYDPLFKKYAEIYGVSWELLKAQALAESNLDPLAISPHGAQGIAQFVPETYAEWAKKLGIHRPNPFDPAQAIQIQAAYMAWLQERMDGNVEATLAAYNWGTGHMHRLLGSLSDPSTWMDHVPKETKHYIAKILTQLARWVA